MQKLFRTVLIAVLLFIYSYANAAGLIPASLNYCGKAIDASAVYDGTQAFIEPSVIPQLGFSYSDSPRSQRVTILEKKSQLISIPVVMVNDTRMIPINDLLKINNTYYTWDETAKTVRIYSKLSAIEFDSDRLRIKCSVPVKYSIKNLGTKYLIDLPYTIVATEAREVPVESDNISLIRIGQYKPDIARVVIEVKSKSGYFVESQPESNLPTIIFGTSIKTAPLIENPTPIQPQPQPQIPQIQAPSSYTINGINFETNNDGNPNVIIYTSSKGIAKAILSFNPNKILISLYNAFIPGELKIENSLPQIKDCEVNKLENQIIINTISPMLAQTQILDDRIVINLTPFYGTGGVLTGKTVIIDPGHGGYDKGARFGSVFEKDLNLQIAGVLSKKLQDIGANAVITRYDDTYIGLADRSKAAKDIKADFFVSIHCNSNKSPGSATGIETYYHMQQPSDKALALCIHRGVCDTTTMCDRKPRSDRSLYSTGLAVLRHLEGSKIPGVLLECGYINHNADRAYLKDSIFQAKLADGIINGLNKYIAGDFPNE